MSNNSTVLKTLLNEADNRVIKNEEVICSVLKDMLSVPVSDLFTRICSPKEDVFCILGLYEDAEYIMTFGEFIVRIKEFAEKSDDDVAKSSVYDILSFLQFGYDIAKENESDNAEDKRYHYAVLDNENGTSALTQSLFYIIDVSAYLKYFSSLETKIGFKQGYFSKVFAYLQNCYKLLEGQSIGELLLWCYMFAPEQQLIEESGLEFEKIKHFQIIDKILVRPIAAYVNSSLFENNIF